MSVVVGLVGFILRLRCPERLELLVYPERAFSVGETFQIEMWDVMLRLRFG